MTQKHDITFGDLVLVDGYDDRPFFVDGWTEETRHEPNVIFEEVWFDITCAWTGEYMMAELDDITRICGADQADDYLMYNTAPPETTSYMPDIFAIGFELDFSGINKTKEESEMKRQPTQRELSSMEAERRKKERAIKKRLIDGYLDELIDYKLLVDEFGDEKYKAKVEYIKIKLAEIMSGERVEK